MSTPNTKKALTPTLSQRARELTAFTLVELIVVITILVIL
jgi:prepilin-type N-terminal cleavage/methylation domain-containing protein